MKRLGVFLPRWNHLKTILPVMQEAHARGIRVSVLCPFPPMTGDGKPELLAASIVDSKLRPAFPWAEWSILKQAPGSWPVDAMIAHGVVHNPEVIKSTKNHQGKVIPWVAVDHLHENAWWYLTGHREFWKPFRRVCLSGDEERYLDTTDTDYSVEDKIANTGYTAFDGPAEDPEKIRAEYGLPKRYLLVGTAVRAGTISGALWNSYFGSSVRSSIARTLSGYRGPTYGKILEVLRDYAKATGMALVGKGRWKHDDHYAHRMFDHHFNDEPTDPARAWRLMQGATVYAGGISGLAVEALAAKVPTLNWTYYDPPVADHPGFHALRLGLWSGADGIWNAPGIGRMFRVYDQKEWQAMVEYLDTVGPFYHHFPPDSFALRTAVIGSGGASARVLEACGL